MAVATDDRSWGRAWHVPSTAVLSVRDLTSRLARIAGVADPHLTRLSADDLAAMGRDSPVVAEVIEMMYTLENPDLLDSTLTERTFGLSATPLDDVLAETVAAFRPA
jgi:hypothetical protein